MSGGSWDYLCFKIEDASDILKTSNCIKRKALGLLMEKVSKAMHDIEWVDSCDYGKGDEMAAIDDCLSYQPLDDAIKSELAELKDRIKNIEALEGGE